MDEAGSRAAAVAPAALARQPSREVAVSAERVTKVFGDGPGAVRALDDVTLSIGRNEFFTLLGPSGCGKTTLLRLIAGFDHPSAGRILLEGEDISTLPPYRRPVNTVFQNYALFPHMTVAQNIAFGLEMLDRPKAEVHARVAEMLRLVRMEELASRRTDQISGGQQQRVALARALAPAPKVLLLDEPLSALDYKLRKDMQLELKRLQHETGITFIFVTHDQEEALTMSDRIAVMNAGRVLQVGTPREIYDHPAERFVADFIGDTNFLDVEFVGRAGPRARLRLASGREVEADLPAGFEVDGLTAGAHLTAAVRPEHATLADPEAAPLAGSVEAVVYRGSDTQYRIVLDDGTRFVVLSHNLRDAAPPLAAGARVGVAFRGPALQLLRD